LSVAVPSVVVRHEEAYARIPFGLVLREDLALRVVANVTDIGVAADVELCGTELGHDDDCGTAMCGEMYNLGSLSRFNPEVRPPSFATSS